MNTRWQQAGQKVKPGFKLAGKLVLLTALRYGPAGVAGWAIKSVARRPLKMLLAVALEPLLSRAANKLAQFGLLMRFGLTIRNCVRKSRDELVSQVA